MYLALASVSIVQPIVHCWPNKKNYTYTICSYKYRLARWSKCKYIVGLLYYAKPKLVCIWRRSLCVCAFLSSFNAVCCLSLCLYRLVLFCLFVLSHFVVGVYSLAFSRVNTPKRPIPFSFIIIITNTEGHHTSVEWKTNKFRCWERTVWDCILSVPGYFSVIGSHINHINLAH